MLLHGRKCFQLSLCLLYLFMCKNLLMWVLTWCFAYEQMQYNVGQPLMHVIYTIIRTILPDVCSCCLRCESGFSDRPTEIKRINVMWYALTLQLIVLWSSTWTTPGTKISGNYYMDQLKEMPEMSNVSETVNPGFFLKERDLERKLRILFIKSHLILFINPLPCHVWPETVYWYVSPDGVCGAWWMPQRRISWYV